MRRTRTGVPAVLLLAAALVAPAGAARGAGAAPVVGGAGEPTPTTTTFNPPFAGEMSAWVNEPEVEGERAPEGEVQFLVDGEVLGTGELSGRSYRDGVWAEATLPDTAPKRRTVVLRARYLPADGWAPSRSYRYERVPPTLVAERESVAPRTRFGWYRAPVTVSWTCTDGSSPVVACPEPVTVDGGVEDLRRTAAGTDGGLAATRDLVRVDQVAPEVSAQRRPGRAPRCVAEDALSGVDECLRIIGGSYEDPDGGTRRAFQMVATDRAGNTATVNGSYRVR